LASLCLLAFSQIEEIWVMSYIFEDKIYDLDPAFINSLRGRVSSNDPNDVAGYFLDHFRHTGIAKQCNGKIPYDRIEFDDNHKFAFYELNSVCTYYCRRRRGSAKEGCVDKNSQCLGNFIRTSHARANSNG